MRLGEQLLRIGRGDGRKPGRRARGQPLGGLRPHHKPVARHRQGDRHGQPDRRPYRIWPQQELRLRCDHNGELRHRRCDRSRPDGRPRWFPGRPNNKVIRDRQCDRNRPDGRPRWFPGRPNKGVVRDRQCQRREFSRWFCRPT